MSEHTPGPWNVCGADRGVCQCMTVLCSDYPIAKVVSGDWGDDYPAIRLTGYSTLDAKAEAYMAQMTYGRIDEKTAKANARLIAAAPDLLEALGDLIEDAEKQMANPSYHMPFSLPKAKAAIAKAESR